LREPLIDPQEQISNVYFTAWKISIVRERFMAFLNFIVLCVCAVPIIIASADYCPCSVTLVYICTQMLCWFIIHEAFVRELSNIVDYFVEC
jgi:hypothetical protein